MPRKANPFSSIDPNIVKSAQPSLKQRVLSFFRLAFSFSIVAVIIWKVGAQDTLSRISNLNPYSLLSAACLIVITFLLHAKRWQLVLSSFHYSWKYTSTLRETWVGYFFNQLLPSSVGGDGVRMLRLQQSGVPSGVAIRSVLVERIFGLIACILLSLIAIPTMLWLSPTSPVTIVVEIATLAGLIGSLFLLRPPLRIMSLFPARIRKEFEILSRRVSHEPNFTHVMLISIAMQLSIATSVGILSWGLGINFNPVIVATLFQPVTLMTLIPISFAGWGIREGSLIAVLGAIGIAGTDALPLSLAFGTVVLITSLPGGLAFSTSKPSPPTHRG